jgi:hypothetical protein
LLGRFSLADGVFLRWQRKAAGEGVQVAHASNRKPNGVNLTHTDGFVAINSTPSAREGAEGGPLHVVVRLAHAALAVILTRLAW